MTELIYALTGFAAVAGFLVWVWLTPCEHRHVRCIHGDEIHRSHGARVRCLACGRSLAGPLPQVCTYTGLVHTWPESP